MPRPKTAGVPPKERIVTIHGVNSRGRWQEDVADTLKCLFEFRSVKYNHYRWLLASQLLFCPFVWIPAVPGLFFAYRFGWIHGALRIALAVIAILAGSFAATFPYRAWAVSTAKRRLANAAKGVKRVHLIAHSFGTYVLGDTIATVPSAKFGRAILGGCVLVEDFMEKHYKKWSWPQKGARTEKYQVLSVRNELASRDWIVRVAAQLVRLVPGFGAAGSKGFSGPNELVHSVSTPNGECPSCWARPGAVMNVQEPPSPAVVHNVFCEGLGHSDYFLSANHAILYWIPFFWGYDPAVYRQFLFICVTAQENFDNGHQTVAEEYYKAMRLSSWGQYPAETMDETILERFDTKLHRIPDNEELDTVALESLSLIIRGQAAMDDENTPNRDKWIRYLNPSVAIQQAFKRVTKV